MKKKTEDTTFASRLRFALTLRHMSAEELTRRVGMPRGTVSAYTNAYYTPGIEKIIGMAKGLGVNPLWLMGYQVDIDEPGKAAATVVAVYSRLPADAPDGKTEDIVSTARISETLAKTGAFFGLVQKGDAMAPFIRDGDVLIARRCARADRDDIVIAALQGKEAVCRRFKRVADNACLVPENAAYDPVMASETDLAILGRIIEIRRTV